MQRSCTLIVGITGLVATGDNGVARGAAVFHKRNCNVEFNDFGGERFAVAVEEAVSDFCFTDGFYGNVHGRFRVALDRTDVFNFGWRFQLSLREERIGWEGEFVPGVAKEVCCFDGKCSGHVQAFYVVFTQELDQRVAGGGVFDAGLACEVLVARK